MFQGIDFTILHMPTFMLGFSYHDEHPESGYHCVEIFLGLFAFSFHFGKE